MNKQLLKDTLDHIKNFPDEWDQTDWCTVTSCGTKFCFAGTVLHLNGYKPVVLNFNKALEQNAIPYFDNSEFLESGITYADMVDPDGNKVDVSDEAAEMLGIDQNTADILFESSNTIAELEELITTLIDTGSLDSLFGHPAVVTATDLDGLRHRPDLRAVLHDVAGVSKHEEDD